LAEVVVANLVEPRLTVGQAIIEHAIDRGEVDAHADVELLATLAPAMSLYRMMIARRPLDRAFLLHIIDRVLIPALTASSHS